MTNQGLIILGKMPLAKFFPFQRGSITLKHLKFAEALSDAHSAKLSTIHERRIDLQIYRAQIKRLLNQNLYFLEIVVDGQKLHKIGVRYMMLIKSGVGLTVSARFNPHDLKYPDAVVLVAAAFSSMATFSSSNTYTFIDLVLLSGSIAIGVTFSLGKL